MEEEWETAGAREGKGAALTAPKDSGGPRTLLDSRHQNRTDGHRRIGHCHCPLAVYSLRAEIIKRKRVTNC